MYVVVILELRKQEKSDPIVLSLVNKKTEILLQFLVYLFRLSITLRMVGSGGCELNP